MNQKIVLQSVTDNLASWPQLLPEVLIATTLGSVLILAILLPQYQRYWLFPVAFVGTLGAWYNKYRLGSHLVLHPALPLCNHLLVLDPLAIFFCLLLLSITLCMLTLLPYQKYPSLDKTYGVAYVVLLLGMLLGGCLLAMAFHWLTIYLGLTLLSLTSALLIGSHKTPSSAEASLKYLLYSMATTALMLWGVAHCYGFTGTLLLSHAGSQLSLQTVPAYIVLASLLLCVSGLLLVLAAVPYHFWMPGVYQGTPAAVVAYLSTMPKLAAIAVLLRISQQLLPQLGVVLQTYAQHGMAILALLTIVVGNAAALVQSNLQRLMAYGSMAQGGLLLAGVAATPNSQISVWYYSVVYGTMGFAIWLAIKILHRMAGSVYLRDCVGLGRQFPLLGGSITLVVLALIGLPPTAGFTGKLLLFTALWDHVQHTESFVFGALLVASLLGTVFSLYYYLKLPYMLFCEATQLPVATSRTKQNDQIALYCLATLLVVGFFATNNLLAVLSSWLGST